MATQAKPNPYPLTLIPGGRTIRTPLGTMRTYEFGPEDGRKVLFVHGDATSSPVFRDIAFGLVKRGCRVLLFDLWGRGHTSSLPPSYPHSIPSFSTQIYFATASSPLDWTTSPGFSIVAFSLGCPIALKTLASLPDSINSLVLMGPAGLIRQLPEEYLVLKAWQIPERETEMRAKVAEACGVRNEGPEGYESGDGSEVAEEGKVDIRAIVQWQFSCHAGFARSFTDTIIQEGAIGQHQVWRDAGKVLRERMVRAKSANSGPEKTKKNMFTGKVLAILGEDDDVVIGKEVEEDIQTCFGDKDIMRIERVPGGHGFPYPNSEKIVELVAEFWGLV